MVIDLFLSAGGAHYPRVRRMIAKNAEIRLLGY
jgi:hypothetical protein